MPVPHLESSSVLVSRVASSHLSTWDTAAPSSLLWLTVPFQCSTGSSSQWAVGTLQRPSWVYLPDTPSAHSYSTRPGAWGAQELCLGSRHRFPSFSVFSAFLAFFGFFKDEREDLDGARSGDHTGSIAILCPHLTPGSVGG